MIELRINEKLFVSKGGWGRGGGVKLRSEKLPLLVQSKKKKKKNVKFMDCSTSR